MSWIGSMLGKLGLGRPGVERLDPTRFGDAMLARLQSRSPGATFTRVEPLRLTARNPAGQESQLFLENAYENYTHHPEALEQILKTYADGALELIQGMPDEVDRHRIIPVVKDRQWIEEARENSRSRGLKEFREPAFEPFGPDLVVIYAEDLPSNIRYLAAQDLAPLGIPAEELRPLAIENLRRLLPKIDQKGANGVWFLVAGGSYEASLLLFDWLWKPRELEVRGEPVFAVPARDLVLVTGSEDQQGLQVLLKTTGEVYSQSPYRVSNRLYRFQDGVPVPLG